MYRINAYKCDFCKKYSSAKSVITKHEKKCFGNPINRACKTCLHYSHRFINVHTNETAPFSDAFTEQVPFCNAGIKYEVVREKSVFAPVFRLKNNCELWKLNTDEFDDELEEQIF